MGAHLIDGQFQSDKYPTTPRGKVPLSVKDASAQDLLWEYAQRRRAIDPEFSADLETALLAAGFTPPPGGAGDAAIEVDFIPVEGGVRLELRPPYYHHPPRVHSALLLAGDTDPSLGEVAAWTEAQRKAAAEWALSVHFAASDNDDVIVPPRPDFIRGAG